MGILLLNILIYYLQILELWFKSYEFLKFISISAICLNSQKMGLTVLYRAGPSPSRGPVGHQPRWHATSACGPPAGLTGAGRPGPARARGGRRQAADGSVDPRRTSPSGGYQTSLRVEEAQLTVAPPANGRRSDEDNDDRRRPAVVYDDGDELVQGRGGEDVPEDGVLTLDA